MASARNNQKGRKVKRKKVVVNISSELDASIKDFLCSKAAQKLGMYSKDRCVEMVMIAFLMRYKDEYKALQDLFKLEDDRIKNAKIEQLRIKEEKRSSAS